MFYLMDGGATLPMGISSEPEWAMTIGDAMMFMLCFFSLQPLITGSAPSSLFIAHDFHMFWVCFQVAPSPQPPVSAQ